MSEFKWNTQYVLEFISSILPSSDLLTREDFIEKVDRFKAKQSKPEWEILKFKHRGFYAIPMKYSSYSEPHFEYPDGQFSLEWALKSYNKCTIHSVKRLADGEVFTVGDKFWVRQQPGEYWVINKFEIGAFKDMRLIGDPWGYNCGLNIALKYPIHQSPIPVLLTPSEIEKLHNILNAY